MYSLMMFSVSRSRLHLPLPGGMLLTLPVKLVSIKESHGRRTYTPKELRITIKALSGQAADVDVIHHHSCIEGANP
jgi:hypothetical protein